MVVSIITCHYFHRQKPYVNPVQAVLVGLTLLASLHCAVIRNLDISPFGLRNICFDFGFFRIEVLSKAPSFTPHIEDYRETEQGFFTAMAGKV